MGEYSPEYARPLERQESNLDLELVSDGESECDVLVRGEPLADEIDSSTDIDAIVDEYKERIQVCLIQIFSNFLIILLHKGCHNSDKLLQR